MISKTRDKINPQELKKWQETEKEFLLVDVLPENYFSQKHIEGAKNACVYEVALC